MLIYNTRTKRKEELVTAQKNVVNIYVCGPTVYDYIHIGNARPLCIFDSLRRYLSFFGGYDVRFTQNFTDIDDKIINKAKEQGKTCHEVADEFIKEYETDAKGLNILAPTFAPRATECIDEMQELIRKIYDSGLAYERNGTVYFRSRKFPDYGKLSGMVLGELSTGARVDLDKEKEDEYDFVLWKAEKPEEEISWPSPWGRGRPGWHTECAAMIAKTFGGPADIHCGGKDLIFPHHENENAQYMACCQKPIANYWMHNGHINIASQKMSKSLGNFFTVRDVAQEVGYMPIRLIMLQSHYRTPVNFGKEQLEQSRAALERLKNCKELIKSKIDVADDVNTDGSKLAEISKIKSDFLEQLDDDFNTAGAIGVLFELVYQINLACAKETRGNKKYIEAAGILLDEFLYILGLDLDVLKPELDLDVQELIEERTRAREQKDFKRADEIREKLSSMDVVLDDTPTGTRPKKYRGN